MFQYRGAFLLKKTILIDLDGVLNTYNGTFDEQVIPPIKDGAYEFVKNLSKDYKIKIFTTRNRLLAAEWLINNGLNKFIDDRCINFNGNYDDLKNKIINFKVWYK